MTKQEQNELYDSLYYCHDAELEISGQHYFIEWGDAGIDVFAITEDTGTKVTAIPMGEKTEMLSKLFEYKFGEKTDLKTSYADIKIVDIE